MPLCPCSWRYRGWLLSLASILPCTGVEVDKDIFYLADQAHVPHGSRQLVEVREFSERCDGFHRRAWAAVSSGGEERGCAGRWLARWTGRLREGGGLTRTSMQRPD